MKRTCFFAAGLLTIPCLVLACGGSTPPPEEPESASVEEEAPEASGEEAGHDLDVGMEFADDEEEADEEEAEQDHGPPPTQTYSPASRMEEDSKKIGESDSSE